jgi:hypothetical protein
MRHPYQLILCSLLLITALPAARPQAAVTTADSLRLLHRALREAVRMQLPPSLPDERYGTPFAKNFSLDFSRSDANDGYRLEIPEKRLDPGTGRLTGGGRYLVPVRRLDLAGIRILTDAENGRLALVLPARSGNTFLYHPYDQRPDEQPDVVLLGWYDPVQERTLLRILHQLQSFLAVLSAVDAAE